MQEQVAPSRNDVEREIKIDFNLERKVILKFWQFHHNKFYLKVDT